jgi:hypothetical protein
MATLHAALGQDAHATRDELFQHLGSNEFLALTAMSLWFYHHLDVVAIKVSYFSAIARRLITLIERLQSLPRVYGYHV